MDPVRTLLQRSSTSLTSGATMRAVNDAREALTLSRGDEVLELASLDALGAALWARGELHLAATVLGAADRLRQRTGQPHPTSGIAEVVPQSPGWEEGRHLRPDEIMVMMSSARSTDGRPTSGWGSLTSSERQVVELAVEGLSNPRIAQQLFLSTNTVKTHLQRAYRKLGVSSRTELSQVPR
ncbi:MAG: response regulator transcription factor [Mycobacteriales bacterium]